MKWRVVFAAAASLPALALQTIAATTQEMFLHVDPSIDDYWHVASSDPEVVRWEKPAGATKAEFERTSSGVPVEVREIYENAAAFPSGSPLACAADERVFDIALTFDDPDRTVKKATVAFLADVSEVRNPDGRDWDRVKGSVLLPVPASATSLTVGGASIPVGMHGGANRWWFFPANIHDAPVDMRLEADGETYLASVVCRISGMRLMVR